MISIFVNILVIIHTIGLLNMQITVIIKCNLMYILILFILQNKNIYIFK